MGCLSDETVLAFAQGRLDQSRRDGVEGHIAGCAACRALVAETAKSLFQPDDADDAGRATQSPTHLPEYQRKKMAPLQPGAMVSRYRVEEVIGEGGAAIVYRAHDPQLERMVALKILRPRRALRGPEGMNRLLEEARAMARLQHPNVVTAFDAGVYQDSVFIAMELVRGETLGRWLKRAPRSWREVLTAFVSAARGLAAAHAAGLVHGDFKPDNVLVDGEGRVRVGDFGLARRAPAAGEDASGSGSGGSAGGGTPAFMAPEQYLERDADAASDQFSFCVALWWGLYGRLPFATGAELDIDTYAERLVRGDVEPPPRERDVPAWLERLVRRGLRVDPAARHPSMQALLGELEEVPIPVRARELWRAHPVAVVLGTAALLAAAGGWLGRARLAAALARCGDGVVAGAEQCDDGNADDGDSCLSSCRFNRCGDGHVRRGVEQCDDGNRAEDDGCTSACVRCDAGVARLALVANGHCYSRHDQPVSWDQARASCVALDGDLAAYNLPTVEVRSAYQHLLAPDPRPLWVGVLGERSWRAAKWVTFQPLDQNWWDSPRRGDCVVEVQLERPPPTNRERSWGLRGVPCAGPFGFVCEQPGWRVSPADNHAYRTFTQTKPWQAAADTCAALGAHLVTMDDARERTFVLDAGEGLYWIGARRDASDRIRWLGGAEVAPVGFGPREPDRSGDCLVVDVPRTLHDRPCNSEYPFMCEKDR